VDLLLNKALWVLLDSQALRALQEDREAEWEEQDLRVRLVQQDLQVPWAWARLVLQVLPDPPVPLELLALRVLQDLLGPRVQLALQVQ
jgi:hypothetical protein